MAVGSSRRTEPTTDLQAVQTRHQDVEDDEVGSAPAGLVQRGDAVGHGDDRVPVPGQRRLQRSRDILVVLGHENHHDA